jgi:glycosyltransferase involved in cell wall biosynthesis
MTSADGTTGNEDAGEDFERPQSAAERREARQAAAKSRQAVSGFIALADRHRDARDWEAARAGYEEVLAIDPNLQHIWIQLGHARKESGDLPAAELAYREALRLKPNDADGHLQLGHLFKVRGQPSMAIEFYSRAAELDPDNGDVQAELTRLRGRVETRPSSPVAQVRGGAPVMARRQPRAAKPSDGKTLEIVFDVSDLMHYFRNARLPTGIQRVQIEVIRNALESAAEGLAFSIVCFTKETDFWVEIPPSLFRTLCRQAVVGGDHEATEWRSLLAQLDAVLYGKQYYAFSRGAVLLNLGTSWWLQNYFLNVRLAKALYGIRYVPFVHDFIPVMAPEHCVAELRQDFISWAIGAFDHADYFLVNSKATLADLNMVCKKLGYKQREAAVVTLDADFRKTLPADAWEEVGDPVDFLASLGLGKSNYVLFVSTIESRKNHLAAFSVWLKLIKKRGLKNVPKLVCVGNPGWLNDAAYAKLNASDLLKEHVLMLSKISDAALAVLYENSVCTLYPSSYEGWGLPVTEALCYGKVPIVSNVSSLPEAGGPFAEYFDVESEKDLMDAVERVVYDEKYRTRREQKIQAEFRPRPWSAISAQIVGQLRDWVKTHANDPAPQAAVPSAHGIWPVEAELGQLHTLTSNTSSSLWAGLKSGEIYRNGNNWWWPEHWGSWIKGTGPGQVALLLKDVANSGIEIYVGLKGIQGSVCTATLKSEGAPNAVVPLQPDQDKVTTLSLTPQSESDRLVVISVTSDVASDFRASSGGKDFRTSGVGVRWVYACRSGDVLARLKIVEAIALNDFERLKRQPANQDFFLHT